MSVHLQWLATVMPLTIRHGHKLSPSEAHYIHERIGERIYAYLHDTQPDVARAIYRPATGFGALH